MFEPVKITVTDHAELIELSKTDNLPYAYISAIAKENIAITIGERLYLVDIPKLKHDQLRVGQHFILEQTFFTNVVTFIETPHQYQRAQFTCDLCKPTLGDEDKH